MDVKSFTEYLLQDNLICDQYRDRVSASHSKAELFEMLSDTNGCEFICSKISPEHPVDYEKVAKYFINHINGKRTITHRTPDGEYTSKIFCNHNGAIVGDTTLLALLGCNSRVEVKEGHILQIFCDCGTVCEIICPRGSRAVCAYWGEMPSVSGAGEVRFIKGARGSRV